ncbi:MAG: HDOD domain-containing protein [Planctomycetes bacterium]|nr:HDOD domain-containing protein [Planctomycetota bacterium]
MEKPHKIDDLIENVQDLPTLPTVVSKINSMTSNPQTNASDIGKVISNDPSLSSKILKLVNSAYYGFPRKINSVTKAIVLLGFNKVKNIAVSASVVDVFKRTSGKIHFDFLQFWEHSVGTAIAAEVVSKHLCPEVIDDAFVGGLLHDVGKVVMANHIKPAAAVFANAPTAKKTFNELCTETIGYDQNHVGALLTEHWNFPDVLCQTIRHWNTPEKARTQREVVFCVHLGNVIVSALGVAAPGDFAMPQVSRDVWDELKLDEAKLEPIMNETLTGFDNASAFLELAK